MYKNSNYKYQYVIAVILLLIIWLFAGDIFLHRSPFILPIICIALLVALMVIVKPILGLYIIIGGMCLSGGLLSIGDEENIITFFSDLPLPLNLNLFELLSLGIIVVLYAVICLKKEIVLFEESRTSHAIYAFSAALVLSWLIYSLRVGSFEGLYELRRLMYIPLVFIFMINLIKNQEQLKYVINLFIICTGIKGILGLINAAISGKFVFLYSGWAESTLFLTVLFFYVGFKEHYSTHPMVKRIKFFMIPMALCFLFSSRRTLWGSSLVTLLVYLFFLRRTQRIKFIGFIFCAAIFFAVAIFFSGNEIVIDEVYSMKNPLEAHTFILRQWEWKNAWEYIKMKPLLGHGLGSVLLPVVDFKYIFRTGYASMIFHNNYLWIWVKSGLVALAPFLFLIFMWFKNTYQLYCNSKDPYYKSILLGIFLCIINFIIAGFISPTMAELKLNIWLGFLFGIVVLIRHFISAQQQ